MKGKKARGDAASRWLSNHAMREKKAAAKSEKPPKVKKVRRPKTRWRPKGHSFYRSPAWAKVRYEVLVKAEGRCGCCGRSAQDGVVLNVDHIKPRKLYPELALDPTNLQVLCGLCNKGKGNWDETNWQTDRRLDAEHLAALRIAGLMN